MDNIDASAINFIQPNDFELHDFIDEANLNQFISSIRGEDHVANQDVNFSSYLVGDCLMDGNNQFIDPNLGDTFGFNDRVVNHNTDFIFNEFPEFGGDMNHEEEDNDGEDSSATTTTTTTTTTNTNTNATPNKRTKVDRSRTLISERRRRGRMKEKLYALRSLVPNITKMDKASIVGDAVLYVQELQMQAKKLKADIAALESSLACSERINQDQDQDHYQSQRRTQMLNNNHPISCKIFQVDVFQVEERGFYVRLVSNKDVGVAVSLYRALESLKSFNVQSSNLATASNKFIFTFTLNQVKGYEHGFNLPNLKLWITGTLLNQGFELETPTSA